MITVRSSRIQKECRRTHVFTTISDKKYINTCNQRLWNHCILTVEEPTSTSTTRRTRYQADAGRRLMLMHDVAALEADIDENELAIDHAVVERRRRRKGERGGKDDGGLGNGWWDEPSLISTSIWWQNWRMKIRFLSRTSWGCRQPCSENWLQDCMGERIEKQKTFFRSALCPELKLAITLRHLATWGSYKSLMYGFRVAHNTISLLVRDVCEAIITEYANEVISCPTTPERCSR